MRRLVRRAACTSVLALSLVLSAGCASTSSPGDAAAPPSQGTPAAADSGSGGPVGYPPAPSDVSGMRGWFEEAYPDASWLARVKDIAYVAGEVPESGGFSNAIVITTDLDFKTEQAVAGEIVTALGEAHPGWAKQYVVRFADGDNLQAGDIFDTTP